ncbi:NlpC/P60 family protein [Streptomyces sp. NPDC006784]|uniref:C40 family peptidase n=1 Tax=Streptomyces sp. NPDC006784 TaxID=3364764 RepID=UPI0036919251
MTIKRVLNMLGAVLVAVTLGIGVGLLLLIAAFEDDDEGFGVQFASSDSLSPGTVPARYRGMIEEAAANCDEGLSPSLLAAQLQQESGFGAKAKSEANARGIAQFIPATWEHYKTDGNGNGTKSEWEPADAIAAQGKYMCDLMGEAKKHPEYNGSANELALAGYNAGWGAVRRHRGVPPQSFAGGQTYNYVRTIMASVPRFAAPKGSADATLPKGFSLPADTPERVKTAVAWALKARGGMYQWGGQCTDPHASSAKRMQRCDCSSLMQQAYRAAGIDIPRTTYDQVNAGKQVSMDKPKPGDLVFNAGSDGSDARPGHVGMYIGDNMIVEAPRSGVKTRLVTYSSWRQSTKAITRITEVRRVVDWDHTVSV